MSTPDDLQGPPYAIPDDIELTFFRTFIERQAAGIPHCVSRAPSCTGLSAVPSPSTPRSPLPFVHPFDPNESRAPFYPCSLIPQWFSSQSKEGVISHVQDLSVQIEVPIPCVQAVGGSSDIYRGELTPTVPSLSKIYVVNSVMVGLKLLRVNFYDRTDLIKTLERFECEVSIWRRLQHPSIAEFLGISFQLWGRPALVMRWYDNGTAPEYIEKHSDVDRIRLALEVAEGLEYLHTLDPPILHGDVKGNNILITNEGRAVLTDFGLSIMLGDSSPSEHSASNFPGTLRWQAPELFPAVFAASFSSSNSPGTGEESVRPIIPTTAADIWSFGCTMYELHVGKVPYHCTSHYLNIIKFITQGITPVQADPALPSAATMPLELMFECWCLPPEDRPTAQEIVRRLRHLKDEG